MEGELKQVRPRGRNRDRSSPADLIGDLWDRARYGNYFECLGLPEDAGTSEVRDAWLGLFGMISDLRPACQGNLEWLTALDQVEKIGADAFEVLSDPDLRLAYLRALAG